MSNEIINANVLKAHLAINVKDVSNSIEFYKKMFGIEPSKGRTGYAKFDVQTPPLNFTLNQVPFDGAGALSHLGVQVGSSADVVAMKSFWEEQGLIASEWGQTENNRRAKFYSLTRKGRTAAQAEVNGWYRLSRAITQVLRAIEQEA